MNTPVHEYVSTKRDFMDAQRLHRSNRRWAAIGYWFWFCIVPSLGLAIGIHAAFVWIHEGREAAAPYLPAAGAGIYFAVLMPLCRWFQIRRLWSQAQPKKYRGMPVTFQFDDEQVVSARPGESEGRFHWNAIEDFAEDERLALLYVRRRLFLFIPKRAMDEPEWQRLRTLALPRKGKS